MYSVRIHTELADRIDAEFYNPDALATLRLLERGGAFITLGDAIGNGYRVVYHGVDSCPAGTATTPFLSPTQIDDTGTIAFEKTTDVPAYYRQKYPKGLAEPGELLIEVKGNASKVAVIPDEFPEGLMISGSLYKAAIRPELNSRFVLSFLRSRFGQILKARLTSNTIIDYIAKEALYSIPVPKPHVDAQRYIGDKVRLAERLRERARSLESESSAFFLLPEWTEPRAGARRAYTAGRGALRSERLDAPFYDPGHEALEALLRRRGDLELSEAATLVESRWKRGGDKFRYFEIGGLDIASGILAPTVTKVAGAPSRAQILVEPWDVLVSTVRPNRKNVGLVLPSDDGLPLVASTGFSVLRFKTAESAAFYHAFLRSDAATQQLMRWNTGATYPAIENNVPLRVRAPRYEGDDVRRMGKRWLQKFTALSVSGVLTSAATTLVEHLIEGKLTEADLSAAQRVLESGNRGLDRAILQALRQNGNPAQPLIANLDGLYALLDDLDAEANA